VLWCVVKTLACYAISIQPLIGQRLPTHYTATHQLNELLFKRSVALTLYWIMMNTLIIRFNQLYASQLLTIEHLVCIDEYVHRCIDCTIYPCKKITIFFCTDEKGQKNPKKIFFFQYFLDYQKTVRKVK